MPLDRNHVSESIDNNKHRPKSSQVDIEYAIRELFKNGGERSPNRLWDWIAIFSWRIVQYTVFRFSFDTWNGWRSLLLRFFGARVGKGCIIRKTASVLFPWRLTLGDRCVIGDRVLIYNVDQVTIGPHAIISWGARLCSGTHDYTSNRMPLVGRPIEVEAGAWVCAEAFVGPGVRVGALAVLGARAVAFKDLPRAMVCVGNPCHPIKQRGLQDKDVASET